MKFTGQFIGATIDLAAYKTRLEAYLTERVQVAARAWLRGVTGRVPIWAGEAQGSLLELSRLIDGRLVISPKHGNRTKIGQAAGSAEAIYGPNDFRITVTTDVYHYNIQEHGTGVSPSAPWKSLAAGAAAALPVIESTRLPVPFIKPVKIKGL